MKKTLSILTAITMAGSAFAQSAPQLSPDNIDEVIAAMTTEEKVHLLIGTGMDGFSDGESAVVGETKNLVPGAAGTTYPVPRLGIPSIVLADGPAGLRINPTREGDSQTYYATHFPIGTLLASTWDPVLVESVGEAIGNEVLEYGADVLLAPALNIHRNPLNGRNFEYYSEDPYIAGKIAAAYVRGVQKNGVGTSIKHYAANNQETNRTGNDVRVSPRAMREIYLPGFRIAVEESDPWTVMSSYNLVNGTYTSEDPDLQTVILREEWGYPGMVMTDWFGGKDAPAQIRAGNDMLQPGYQKQYDMIIEALNDGTLSMEDVDRDVKRVLQLVVRTPRFKGYKYSNKPDLKAHAEVTRQSATEGMVLLKNDNDVLPLSPDIKNVALFGVTSYDFIPGGTGSGNVNRAYTVSLLDGLTGHGYNVDPTLKKTYEKYIAKEEEKQRKRLEKEKKDNNWAVLFNQPRPDEITFSEKELKKFVADNDVALITIGRNSGEFFDRTTSDFELTPANRKLIEQVAQAFQSQGKPVVVVLNVGGVIETDSWKGLPDGILLAWQGGQEGGNSVADILAGEANPSGKLTMTWPVNLSDHYSTLNFPLDLNVDVSSFLDRDNIGGDRKNFDYTDYEEDIYVGYRYFDAFGKEVSYPFGYGLSFTEFEYGQPSISYADGVYTVEVPVKNVGKKAGKEVVQLYVAAPDAKTANKPDKELKAFGKTSLLQPGEGEVLTLRVPRRSLASYDEDAVAWVVTPGEYEFLVGASSRDIKSTLKADVAASKHATHDVLKQSAPLNTLKRK
ncbi:MAG: glycoside hydrolase family 3 protein [Muribaculaceae bacterium]|nr:glycoside hydrolase family 3 protein [Muribaculaceae bacterium]